jgi:LacI family transcriptional regulator
MADREKANVKTLLASQVDGILVSVSKATTDFSHLEKIQKNEVPLVFYDRIVPNFKADQVIIDDFDAAYRATRHLTDSGKKRIAHFAGPQNLLIGQQRKEGYKKALEEAGLNLGETLVFDADNFEKARLAVLKIIESGTEIDGIFAVNDLTAIGAMQTLQKRGIKIPHEVAVVGFSDGRFSGITDPTLTSVDQHGYEMGTVATRMLLKRILSKDDYPAETKILNANLIVRGSSLVS